MSILKLYDELKRTGAVPMGKNDQQKAAKLKAYKDARSALFEELKKMYESKNLRSERADEIYKRIQEEASDPLSFWGSEKGLLHNRLTFAEDMNSRLFKELLNAWEAENGLLET